MEAYFQLMKLEKIKLAWIYINREGVISQRVVRVVDIQDEQIIAYFYERKQVGTIIKDHILSVLPLTSIRKSYGV
ncbi:hypothetical protein LC065_15115 [Halobacillus litoralis]|uniref:hypothetical protein n=1 Tax=Halobacillus litoralis TaxID=45668 RepID=UPI001CFCF19F|nr:hypothetical protein [Halobacillus litoralis]WLR46870.1 hypothetical protein LC065_15115 [Halobacillus litoralis]